VLRQGKAQVLLRVYPASSIFSNREDDRQGTRSANPATARGSVLCIGIRARPPPLQDLPATSLRQALEQRIEREGNREGGLEEGWRGREGHEEDDG
jgi:hypothetical protein